MVPEPATLRNRQFSGKPVVSTGFEAGFLPLRMGTDSSVTGNTPEPTTLSNRQLSEPVALLYVTSNSV